MDSNVFTIYQLNGLSLGYVSAKTLAKFLEEHVVSLHLVHYLGMLQLLLNCYAFLADIVASNVPNMIV